MHEAGAASARAAPGLWVYLRLARGSNLPTIWTDVLAGVALAGAAPSPASIALLLAAFSLFYTAGMFLNDAFDRDIDASERPERPIPAGQIGAGQVFALGLGMLALAWAGVLAHTALFGGSHAAPLAAGALAAAVVLYDVWHKGNSWSPVLMGLCRALVYVTSALAVAETLGPAVVAGAVILWGYVIGVTHIAKRELLGHTGVAGLIAGIALLDALLIASAGSPILAGIAALGFPLTLLLQRYVRGT